jgi:hypothetical protein
MGRAGEILKHVWRYCDSVLDKVADLDPLRPISLADDDDDVRPAKRRRLKKKKAVVLAVTVDTYNIPEDIIEVDLVCPDCSVGVWHVFKTEYLCPYCSRQLRCYVCKTQCDNPVEAPHLQVLR